MGRKRRPDQLPPKPRTRAGCQTCRARKVKCDETRPVCQRCQVACRPCDFKPEVKWEDEYISKGLAFGREGVWSKLGNASRSQPEPEHWSPIPTVRPYHFLNYFAKTFEEPLALEVGNAYRNPRANMEGGAPLQRLASRLNATLDDDVSYRSRHSYAGALIRSHSVPLIPGLVDADHSMLLNYFIQKLCPLTTPSKLSQSPFASLVLPFTLMNSNSGLLSILALSACHRAKSEPAWKLPAMKLKSQVLQVLQDRFNVEGPEKVAASSDTLVTMVILCLYEIIQDCDSGWVVHLKGAHDILSFRKELQATQGTEVEVNELTAFAEKFFAFHDVIGRTACGQVPLFGRDYWNFGEKVVDVWMGCSPELVALLCTINELSRAAYANPEISVSDAFLSACSVTRYKLESLEQVVENDQDDYLLLSAKMKRLAAMVYLNCALYNAHPTTPLMISLVEQILLLASDFIDLGFVNGLTWPLFVAAVELNPYNDEILIDDSHHRPFHGRLMVLKVLQAMETSTVSNVDRMRTIISQVWQARDLEEDPFPETADNHYCRNDWERYVFPVSENINLV
ncbi:fungal-specific transcription factor domain-containing protein [Exophiala viscosa]|uniref:Fungal-specific transcription factor domain-containing protein n=1 Tax=Exophiala viscosa TaxID=2486360 RepID=A0AAN6DWZ6_9EURO|nr:fungal-specific transcription factor domain-containing protein [Exophiala viscosa]